VKHFPQNIGSALVDVVITLQLWLYPVVPCNQVRKCGDVCSESL